MAVTTYLDRLCADLLIKYYFIIKQDPSVMSKEKVAKYTATFTTEPSLDISAATNINSHHESSNCTSSLLSYVRSGELEVNDVVVVSVSNDEDSTCYKDLFIQLQLISIQENNRPFFVNFIMVDDAPGITKTQKDLSSGAKRLMCWAQVIRKCREHCKLVPKDKWNQIDLDIHDLQLRYEGAGINVPSTNNGRESLNGKIKQQYTLRNKLHLSLFLPKIEQMLHDWSTNSFLNGFVTKSSISTTLELVSIKWSTSIDKISILHWFDTWYIVPSSNSLITPAIWLQMYQQQHWTSFFEFTI
ncbi:unnamed protein product [Rotaria sordida]|uniref:Uncharacterized protein n=1 Tax=Rotaria sordida TaxID=392033 RepID=A0A813ZLZ9_9BILA|nr:unnamed protein product [Rotaria sordida]CAF3604412.1 unnamed protein product [Rotaria sordida]